jgi:uncharacterized protein YbbC (DUF1343 family)
MTAERVHIGLENLLSDHLHVLEGKRVGLICNASTILPDLRHAIDVFAAHESFELVRLFGPEHGLRGDAQDMIPVDGGETDRRTGLPIVSLYGHDEHALRPAPATFEDLDVIVFDIQDVGARYYTYVYTLAHAMETAQTTETLIVVCDRPNPIGGLVEGNIVQDGFRSFVGRFPLPNRHGMTAGELAAWFKNDQGIDCPLYVVPMTGWSRDRAYADCGLPWVQPSPNMPTVETALVYPGMCFFEGTLLSEGRGCTRPFEVVGAPYVDGHAWAEAAGADLEGAGYGGFALRPLVFRPTFHKHASLACGGIQLHVTDPFAFRPVMTATALLKAAWMLWPADVAWRTEAYEYVVDPIAIDLLGGSVALREEIEGGADLREIQARWDSESAEFREIRQKYLVYP